LIKKTYKIKKRQQKEWEYNLREKHLRMMKFEKQIPNKINSN
jgi:hypothetical protein